MVLSAYAPAGLPTPPSWVARSALIVATNWPAPGPDPPTVHHDVGVRTTLRRSWSRAAHDGVGAVARLANNNVVPRETCDATWWVLGAFFLLRIPTGIQPGEDAEHRLLDALERRRAAADRR